MDNESIVEQIVRSLSFEVEAVPQDTVVKVSSTSKSTPLNLKIKIRKKDEAAIQHGFISVPKVDKPDSIPNRIRLVSSDQTLMSFDVLMETDLAQKPLRKPRKHIFDILRPGACLDAQRDDDHYSYIPKSEGSNSSEYEDVIKQNLPLYKINDNNTAASPSHSYRHKTFFGKCKPGGCLDPPFSEDKYAYEPATPRHVISPNDISEEKILDYKDSSCREKYDNNSLFKRKKRSIDSSSQRQEIRPNSILSLYQAESIRTSTTYSNSIITYPTDVTSSEFRITDTKTEKNRVSSDDKSTKSVNEVIESYYIPPKKVTNQLYQNGEDNLSYKDQNRLSEKEENININRNMQRVQSQANIKNQKSNERVSKESDSFGKNVESFQVKVPELFLKHQNFFEIKTKNTDSFEKDYKTESFTNVEIKPKYLKPSQLETMFAVSRHNLDVATSDLKTANNHKSMHETHPKRKSQEIQLQIKSTDTQDSQDGQENKKKEQNDIQKENIPNTSSLSDNRQVLAFIPKTDHLVDKGENKSKLLLEQTGNKKDVTQEYGSLPIEHLNKNNNISDVDEINNKVISLGINNERKRKLSHDSTILIEDKNRSKSKERLSLKKSENSLSGEDTPMSSVNQRLFIPYNLEIMKSSSKTSTALDLDVYEKYNKFADGEGTSFPKNERLKKQLETETTDSKIIKTKNDTAMELNQISKGESEAVDMAQTLQLNILDNLAKNETTDVLSKYSKETIKIEERPPNSETVILMLNTSLDHGKSNAPGVHGLSKDISKKNDFDKSEILNLPQAFRSGPDIVTKNNHFLVADNKNENECFDENFKQSNIQDKFGLENIFESSLLDNLQLIHTLSETKIDKTNNQNKDCIIPVDVVSLKLNNLETPHSSKQDIEKIEDEYVLNNNIKPSLRMTEENDNFSRKGECISGNISPEANKSNIIIATGEQKISDSEIHTEETSTLLQLQMHNKIILKKDTLSVELDIAFQSYLNNNNERVLKSFNSATMPERFSKDSIIILKSQIRTSSSNEIKFPIDSDNDLSIQIKKSTIATQQGSELENFRQGRKMNFVTRSNKSISGNELETKDINNSEINKCTTTISDVVPHDTLISMYEQELLPLQNIIKDLKGEIDILAKQKTIFNNKLRSLKTANTMRLIKVNKNCGCLRK